MQLKTKLNNIYRVSKARLFNKRIPVVVSWAITYRCNFRCIFCDIPKKPSKEVSRDEAKLVLDKLCSLGLSMLNFTGGEPCLRLDIGDLINYAKNKGLFVGLNSNGMLIPKMIKKLKHLDLISLSVEGPPSINDRIRGQGSYEILIDAAKQAKKNQIPVRFVSTLNKLNLKSIEDIVKLACSFNTKVAFQVVDSYCLGSQDKNPVLPERDELLTALNEIIKLKTNSMYAKTIGNSLSCLKYLLDWPDLPYLECASGKIAFRLTPEGKMIPCPRGNFKNHTGKPFSIDILTLSIQKIKEKLHDLDDFELRCTCTCTNRIETNLIWNINRTAIREMLRF